MVRAISDGVGVSVSIGPPCCGVYVGKATQPVPTVPPVLAGHKGTAVLRRYIREGSLCCENAASAVGLPGGRRRRIGAPATVELFAGYWLCQPYCDRLGRRP